MKQGDPLSEMWQSIQSDVKLNSDKIFKQARRDALINNAMLIFDCLGSVIIAVILWLAITTGPYAMIFVLWLIAALIFNSWLAWKLFVTRNVKVKRLDKATVDYQRYLMDGAESDIKVGRIFIRTNHVVFISLALTVAFDQLTGQPPLIRSAQQWSFALIWSVFVYGATYWYGVRKMKKGKQRMNGLKQL